MPFESGAALFLIACVRILLCFHRECSDPALFSPSSSSSSSSPPPPPHFRIEHAKGKTCRRPGPGVHDSHIQHAIRVGACPVSHCVCSDPALLSSSLFGSCSVFIACVRIQSCSHYIYSDPVLFPLHMVRTEPCFHCIWFEPSPVFFFSLLLLLIVSVLPYVLHRFFSFLSSSAAAAAAAAAVCLSVCLSVLWSEEWSQSSRVCLRLGGAFDLALRTAPRPSADLPASGRGGRAALLWPLLPPPPHRRRPWLLSVERRTRM